MKVIFYSLIVSSILFASCNSKKKSTAQNVSFGLYETVRIIDLPASLFDSIKISSIKPQYDKGLPIVGYLTREDFVKFQSDYSRNSLRFLRTAYPVDPEGKYYAVVAVKYPSIIGNADVSDVKNEDKKAILHFNMSGAGKWANVTKNNVGKMVAFVIDDLVYSTPEVNAEIKSGTAMINGFPDQESARKISDALNSSLPR